MHLIIARKKHYDKMPFIVCEYQLCSHLWKVRVSSGNGSVQVQNVCMCECVFMSVSLFDRSLKLSVDILL